MAAGLRIVSHHLQHMVRPTTFAVARLANGQNRGLVLCFGAFQSFYQAQLLHEYSPSAISWIGTTEVFLLNVVGFLTGPLFDLGYHDALLFSSSGIVVFAVMMLSLSTKFYQIFLSQGICLGVGSGILNVPSLALVAGSFTTKRPLAVTLVTAGSAIGNKHTHHPHRYERS